MFCKKCGSEIEEGNSFCTNCGIFLNIDELSKDEINLNTKKIKIKAWHIIVFFIVFICIVIGIIFFYRNIIPKQINDITNINEQEMTILKEKEYQVEIGIKYSYILEDEAGWIRFNTVSDFEMSCGIPYSEGSIDTGKYIIDGNILKLTFDYENEDNSKEPIIIEMTILDDGNIKEITEHRTYLYIKEENNIPTDDISDTSTNLLDTIYDKYPNLKNKDGYICTDGEQYWLLDNVGKKIYFYDMESFESALVQVYTSEKQSIEDENFNTNSNTTTNISQSSNGQLSETKLKYNQIKDGMNYYEVISILSEPKSTNNIGSVRNCTWTFQPETIIIQFMNNCVYKKIFNENKSNSTKLDPETTHFINFFEGFELQEYTEQLDSWGIKYEVIKQENFNYDNNVVTNIEPNCCSIDKNTIVTFTVSDNTYDMDVLVDTQYLLRLAGLDISEYNSVYNYELGKYVRDNVKLALKINGNIIFDGQTELLDIGGAIPLGKVKGKPTDTYKIEICIENVQVTKEIHYNIRCYKDSQRFEIYEGGDIGAG